MGANVGKFSPSVALFLVWRRKIPCSIFVPEGIVDVAGGEKNVTVPVPKKKVVRV